MAIGMCVACDEWFDESEYDWDLEMCLAHAEEHYEEEEEEEYNSDSKHEFAISLEASFGAEGFMGDD
jgi:hypothetical protein